MNNQNEPILQKHITRVLKEALKDYDCGVFVTKPRIVEVDADKCVAKVEVFLAFERDNNDK